MDKGSVWIHFDVLSGETQRDGIRYIRDDEWKKHYEILNHANYLLEIEKSDHDRACAIFQLNRAVELRDKFLSKIYHFRRIKSFKGLGQSEIMENLDMIKPMLKSKLDSIRNRVMHKADENAPSSQICRELSEFVWYFLRVTDIYARNTVEDFSIYSSVNGNGNEVSITVNLENRDYKLGAAIHKSLISDIRTDGCFEVLLSKEIYAEGGNFLYINGLVAPSEDAEKIIMKKYFESYQE